MEPNGSHGEGRGSATHPAAVSRANASYVRGVWPSKAVNVSMSPGRAVKQWPVFFRATTVHGRDKFALSAECGAQRLVAANREHRSRIRRDIFVRAGGFFAEFGDTDSTVRAGARRLRPASRQLSRCFGFDGDPHDDRAVRRAEGGAPKPGVNPPHRRHRKRRAVKRVPAMCRRMPRMAGKTGPKSW